VASMLCAEKLILDKKKVIAKVTPVISIYPLLHRSSSSACHYAILPHCFGQPATQERPPRAASGYLGPIGAKPRISRVQLP
jgi:hypothetical protein